MSQVTSKMPRTSWGRPRHETIVDAVVQGDRGTNQHVLPDAQRIKCLATDRIGDLTRQSSENFPQPSSNGFGYWQRSCRSSQVLSIERDGLS